MLMWGWYDYYNALIRYYIYITHLKLVLIVN